MDNTPDSNGEAYVASVANVTTLTGYRVYKVDSNGINKENIYDYASSVGQGTVKITWNGGGVTYYNLIQ